MEDHHWGGQGWNSAVKPEKEEHSGQEFCIQFSCRTSALLKRNKTILKKTLDQGFSTFFHRRSLY
jgi:DNA phosphorothioation-dependent restriction protein DptG